jgi:hypothetical protein
MQRRCKCNNTSRTSVARGVFYVIRIYPLLGNGCCRSVSLTFPANLKRYLVSDKIEVGLE